MPFQIVIPFHSVLFAGDQFLSLVLIPAPSPASLEKLQGLSYCSIIHAQMLQGYLAFRFVPRYTEGMSYYTIIHVMSCLIA